MVFTKSPIYGIMLKCSIVESLPINELSVFWKGGRHMNRNGKTFEKSKTFDSPEKLPIFPILCIFLTIVSSSLILPAMFVIESKAAFYISLCTCLLCCVILFISAKKPSKAIWLTVLMAFLAYFVGSPILPALIFGCVISIGSGAALICSAKKWQFAIFALIFPSAYVLSLLITGNFIISLLSCVMLLPILTLGLSNRFGASKTTSVVLCSATIVIPTICLMIISVISTYGQLDRETVTLIADGIKANMISFTEQMYAYFGQAEITEAFKRELAAAVDSYINMSAGSLIALALTASYAAHSLQCNIFSSFALDRFLTEKSLVLTVSVEAAIIFIVAHIASFATDSFGNTSLLAVVGGNLSLILFPAFLVTGFEAIKALPKKLGLLGIIILILLLILIFTMFSQFPIILALLGSFFVIFQNVDSWAKEHYGKGENK